MVARAKSRSPQPRQVLIGVGGLGCPCRASQEPKELEQVAPLVGDRMVDHACPDHREQVLVDEFLFEVLKFLRGPQSVRRAQGTDHGQRLDYITSSKLSIRHSYQRSVGNPDQASNLWTGCEQWLSPAQARTRAPRDSQEPKGLQTLSRAGDS